MRKFCLAGLVLVTACSRGIRKDLTPPLASNAPETAVREAAARDPDGGPALSPSEQVEHVLSRVTFGARPVDRERVARIGISGFLEEQLHPEALHDDRADAVLKNYPVLRRGAGPLARDLTEKRKEKQAAIASAPPPSGFIQHSDKDKRMGSAGPGPGADYVAELSEAKIVRAIASERQLQEVMVDFWFNHFNVFAGKDNEAALLPDYEERAIRPNALRSFGDLLDATAHSPAMLVYLDNRLSTAPPRTRPNRPGLRGPAEENQRGGLNENYARELMELHTLGVDGGYTQQDIVEVARCFTGWTVEQPNEDPRFVFRPKVHDGGEKRVLGHVIAAGGGELDGRRVLQILLDHPSTAHFIATKLARRFVSDDPPESLVVSMAATFSRTRGDIRSVLRTLFESPEFWSRNALRAKVRSPLELVVGSVRGLSGTVDKPLVLARAVARIGEPLYEARPPTGYGDTARSWLSSGALLARIDFGARLANGQLEGVAVQLGALAEGASGAEEVLDRAASRLGVPDLSPETRSLILAQLRESPKPELLAKRAVGLLLGAPELQRR